MAERYLPFYYDRGSPTVIPELGEDHSSVYGYTQTHETLELWLNIWKAYSNDVIDYGTPPRVRRFVDLPTSFWHQCMVNVDSVRRIVQEAMAKRGRNSGPGSLLWFVLMNYLFFQTFCHF